LAFDTGDYAELINKDIRKKDLIWRHQDIIKILPEPQEEGFYWIRYWNSDSGKTCSDRRPADLVDRCYRRLSPEIAKQRCPELFE